MECTLEDTAVTGSCRNRKVKYSVSDGESANDTIIINNQFIRQRLEPQGTLVYSSSNVYEIRKDHTNIPDSMGISQSSQQIVLRTCYRPSRSDFPNYRSIPAGRCMTYLGTLSTQSLPHDNCTPRHSFTLIKNPVVLRMYTYM